MEVEAHDQRQVLAYHLAHAPEDFALAVVEMFRDHRTVQIEINRIELSRRLDALDQYLDDALIGVAGHMRAGTGAARNRRDHLPALSFRRFNESRQPDIDVAHDPEHVCALSHRRPATAMHEVVVGRLRRREGIGLVQEAANGDTGHQLSQTFYFR